MNPHRPIVGPVFDASDLLQNRWLAFLQREVPLHRGGKKLLSNIYTPLMERSAVEAEGATNFVKG